MSDVPTWRTVPPDLTKNILKTSCSDTETFEKPLVFSVFLGFGAFREPCASWKHLGGILETSWSVLEAFWGVLKPSWSVLEASWNRLLECLGAVLERLGVLLQTILPDTENIEKPLVFQ